MHPNQLTDVSHFSKYLSLREATAPVRVVNKDPFQPYRAKVCSTMTYQTASMPPKPENEGRDKLKNPTKYGSSNGVPTEKAMVATGSVVLE